jgi:hypothetical protein
MRSSRPSFGVVVIASRGVKALRTRYGSAGNKDDRADAYVLADVLRTDGHRLHPLRPDTPATVALRALVRARKDLVRTRLRLVQQLDAHLERVFPGAVDLFDDLASPIAVAFLLRFPSAEQAAWFSPKRMAGWLAAQGYSGGRSGAELHARLVAAPVGISGQDEVDHRDEQDGRHLSRPAVLRRWMTVIAHAGGPGTVRDPRARG